MLNSPRACFVGAGLVNLGIEPSSSSSWLPPGNVIPLEGKAYVAVNGQSMTDPAAKRHLCGRYGKVRRAAECRRNLPHIYLN